VKPSYGRISRYGLIAYASSFDQIGIFGKSLNDVSLCMEVISGPDDFDSTASTNVKSLNAKPPSNDESYRIAYFKEVLEHPGLDPIIADSFLNFIKNLEKENIIVEPIPFELLEYVVPTYYVLTTAEASSNLSRYDGIKFGFHTSDNNIDLTTFYKESRSNGFGKEVKRRIMLGTFVLSAGYFDAYFKKAQQVRNLLVKKTKDIFNRFDAIISPTVPAPAFKVGEKTDDPIEMFLADIYTVFANLVGIPAISLPFFSHPNTLPFGLQVMTSQYNEEDLLRISQKFIEIRAKA
jgi:aspartyl-tRNA(Asn)/glutamyl-tRNA(Gln) amidotransferase subunit A